MPLGLLCDLPVQGKYISRWLLSLKQGADSVANFTINFRILKWLGRVCTSGGLLTGLADYIQDELAAHDEISSLEEFI